MAAQSPGPELKDVIKELNNLQVYDWFSLGLQLGLSRQRLRYIEANFTAVSRRLVEVINEWGEQRGGCYSWEELGHALREVPHHSEEGKTILKKHCSLLFPNSMMPPDSVPLSLPSTSHPIPSEERKIILKGRSSGDVMITQSIRLPLPPPISLLMPPDPVPSSLPPDPVPLSLPSDPVPLSLPPDPVPLSLPPDPVPLSLPPDPVPLSLPPDPIPSSLPPYTVPSHPPVPKISHPISSHTSVPQPSLSPSPSRHSISSGGSLVILPSGETSLPTNHPFIPLEHANTSLVHQDIKNSHTAFKTVIRLEQKFTNLFMRVADMLKAENIDVDDIKRFARFSLSLEDREFDSKRTIDEILIFLRRFMTFDNPFLLQSIVYQYIEKQGTPLMDSYYKDIRDFQSCCSCEMYAKAFTQLRREKGNEYSLFHASDLVSVHFNETWENRPVCDLRSFRQREFYRAPEMNYSQMVKLENRSILVSWQTTEAVTKKLSKDCVRSFSHLRTQGVLQIIIGECEIDFSFHGRGEMYKIQKLEGPSHLFRSVSMSTLQSDVSDGSVITEKSNQTKGSGGSSGYSSGEPSLVNFHATITDKQFQPGTLTSTFTSGAVTLQKGDIVTIVSIGSPLALVKTAKEEYVYVPQNILNLQSKMSPSTSFGSSLSNFSEVIVRKRISMKDIKTVPIPESPQNASEDERPDTPPLEAYLEASKITLSDEHNTHPSSSSSLSVSFSLKEEEFITYYYPEVQLPKSSRPSVWKNFLNLLRTRRQPTRSTVSETASHRTSMVSLHSSKTVPTLADSPVAEIAPLADSPTEYLFLSSAGNSRLSVV